MFLGSESEDQSQSAHFPLGLPNSKIATKMYEDSIRAFESNPVSSDVINNLLTEKRMDDYYNWMDDRITKYTACSNVIANEIGTLYKRDDLNLIDFQYLVLFKKFKKILSERGNCSNETISYLIYRLINLVRNDLTLRNLLIVSSDDYVELILTKFVEMALNERIYDYEYNMPKVEDEKMKNIRKHLQRSTKAASVARSVSKIWGWTDNSQYSIQPTPIPGPSQLRPENYYVYGRQMRMNDTERIEYNMNDSFIPIPRVVYPSTQMPFYEQMNPMMLETNIQEQEELKEKKKRSKRFGPRGPYKRTLIRMRMREISRKRRHIRKKLENEELDKEQLENNEKEEVVELDKEQVIELDKEQEQEKELELDNEKEQQQQQVEKEKEVEVNVKEQDEHKEKEKIVKSKKVNKKQEEVVVQEEKPKKYEIWIDFEDIKKISQESTTGENSDTSEFIGWPEKKSRKKYDLSYIEKTLKKRMESMQEIPTYQDYIYNEQMSSGQITPIENINKIPGYSSNYLNLCPELEARENIMVVRSGESTPNTMEVNPIQRKDIENISKLYRKYQMELQNNQNTKLIKKNKQYEIDNMMRINSEMEIMGTTNVNKSMYENTMTKNNLNYKDQEILRRINEMELEISPLQKFKMNNPYHSKPVPENLNVRRSSRINKLNGVNKHDGVTNVVNGINGDHNVEDGDVNPDNNNANGVKDEDDNINHNHNNHNPNDHNNINKDKEKDLKGKNEKRRGDNTIWEMVQKHQKSSSGVTTNVVKQIKQATRIVPEEKDEMSMLIREHYHISENVPPSQTQPFANAYKTPKSVKWTYTDTKRFYNAIETFGTDLMLVRAYLPEYTDRQVYDKFKLEERKNPQLMQNALQTHKSISLKQYEQKNGKIDTSKHYDPKTDPLLQETVINKKKSLQLNPNHNIEVTTESNQKVDDKIINLFM